MEEGYDERFCSLKMETTEPEICMQLYRLQLEEDYKAYDFEDMVVKFKFSHYRETHFMCQDGSSVDPKDHYVLSKELEDESCFEAALVFPLNPRTVEAYLSKARLGDDWPTSKYVSHTTWNRVKKDVCEYILDNADFGSRYGFEMEATLEVSSVVDIAFSNIRDDDDDDDDCFHTTR